MKLVSAVEWSMKLVSAVESSLWLNGNNNKHYGSNGHTEVVDEQYEIPQLLIVQGECNYQKIMYSEVNR